MSNIFWQAITGRKIFLDLETRGRFHQHVYAKLLHMQILVAYEFSQVVSIFLLFWDLCM